MSTTETNPALEQFLKKLGALVAEGVALVTSGSVTTTPTAPARSQDEINAEHEAERVVDEDEVIRVSITGTGMRGGPNNWPMGQFNSYTDIKYPGTLRLAVAALFKEAYGNIESAVISANNVTYNAHARPATRQVLLKSNDGVYEALVSIDEEVEEEPVW